MAPCPECGGKTGHVPGCRTGMKILQDRQAQRHALEKSRRDALVGLRVTAIDAEADYGWDATITFENGAKLKIRCVGGDDGLSVEVVQPWEGA